ncbi:MAG TPA: aminotransferase class I/II-fold pyridoxal phosphate-dependent enzyme, partial [Planctomycetota bacterium]|nr:aminotransferase class I/II-fold pyridoxal phosphate-dependent enzyme [Planctomycetota bacterium]
YQASLAAIVALADQNCSVILDRLCHASLLDGAALSDARKRYFKHNDVTDLGALIRKEDRRCLIVVESLYSMDGDTAWLTEISDLAAATGSLLLVDEAHATGVLGPTGRGALEEFSTGGKLAEHIVALGTLSKALGAQGGYVCGPRWVIDTILHAGRAYMFSTALAPAAVGAAREALRIAARETERRIGLLQRAQTLRRKLAELNFKSIDGTGPIIPVITGDETRATSWSQNLLEAGLLVPGIRYPTVKKGEARLRISLSAAHTDADIQRLIEALAKLRQV